MKAYTVCATALLSMFTVFCSFSQRNCQIVGEVWTMSEQVVKGVEDVRRQTKETPRSRWPLFYKLCKKCYRKSCKYMRNNSTRLKGKKKLQLNNIKVSSTTVMWPTKVGKPWREKRRCTLHAGMASEEFANFILKDDRLANSRDMNTLETIWIIVDETTYKDSAPKTLDELRQRLRFACKNVNIDTLWELVHSIPHRLENVRKHNGRYSSC